MDWLAGLVGTGLVLVGTLLGMWLQHRRWGTDRQRASEEPYRERRRESYFRLWDVVEDAHTTMRRAVGPPDLDAEPILPAYGSSALNPRLLTRLIADANEFMIEQGLYIERADRDLVLDYLFWTYEFIRLADERGSGNLIVITAAHYELPHKVAELSRVGEKHEEARSRLRARILEVVDAPPTKGWAPSVRRSSDLMTRLADLQSQSIVELESGGPSEPPESDSDTQ